MPSLESPLWSGRRTVSSLLAAKTTVDCNGDNLPQDPVDYSSNSTVCYVGGRQFFHDARIGDFSIIFSEAGGVDSNTVDGLHTPILQLADIGDWTDIDMEYCASNPQ